MSIFRRILFATALLFAASCSEEPLSSDVVPEMIDVMIGCGDKGTIVVGEDTRTVLEDDGISIRWDENDRIALWGHNAAGDCVVDGAELAMWRYNTDWDEACFRGSIPAMAEGTYSYYAVSPIPVNAAGNQIFYSIPAVQDGEYHPEWNILAAEPVAGAPSLVNGYNNDILLDFKSRVHLLRIRIPANSLGEKITAIKLSFDRPVVGSMMMDYTDPSSLSLTESGSSSEITLNFATPKDAGDVVYAFIAPVECETISIIAQGTMYESQPRSVAGKMFAAGHTTPIAYTVPARERLMGTIVRLSLPEAQAGANTLGERIKSLTLNVNGAQFGDGSSSMSFNVSDNGTYDIFFHENGTVDPTALAGKAVSVTYTSEHAVVSSSFTMSTVVTKGIINEGAGYGLPTVPYLFEEYFNSVNGNENNVEAGGASISSDNNSEGLAFMGLTDEWSGQRIGSESGNAIKLSAVKGVRQWRGRMTAPCLKNLTKDAHIVVTFNMTGYQKNGNTCTCTVGFSNDTANTKYKYDDGLTATMGTFTPPTNGGYGSINQQISFSTSATKASPSSRLSWLINYGTGGAFNYQTYYLFVDNIRVSIKQ